MLRPATLVPRIKPPTDKSFFQASDDTNKYTYYLQMFAGGLPTANGYLQACTVTASAGVHPASVRAEVGGDPSKCMSSGTVNKVTWSLDQNANPQQQHTLTFYGGDGNRQTTVTVKCDPAADTAAFRFVAETNKEGAAAVIQLAVASKWACNPNDLVDASHGALCTAGACRAFLGDAGDVCDSTPAVCEGVFKTSGATCTDKCTEKSMVQRLEPPLFQPFRPPFRKFHL